MSRYLWVAKEHSNVVEGKHYRQQATLHRKLERENHGIDAARLENRKQWTFYPPSNIVLILHRETGCLPAGLVLSVPQSIGAFILFKRLGRIIESDNVKIDAEIAGDFEEAIEALGLETGGVEI